MRALFILQNLDAALLYHTSRKDTLGVIGKTAVYHGSLIDCASPISCHRRSTPDWLVLTTGVDTLQTDKDWSITHISKAVIGIESGYECFNWLSTLQSSFASRPILVASECADNDDYLHEWNTIFVPLR
jgi:hypothetical protein